jgi:hypothetical protein
LLCDDRLRSHPITLLPYLQLQADCVGHSHRLAISCIIASMPSALEDLERHVIAAAVKTCAAMATKRWTDTCTHVASTYTHHLSLVMTMFTRHVRVFCYVCAHASWCSAFRCVPSMMSTLRCSSALSTLLVLCHRNHHEPTGGRTGQHVCGVILSSQA